MNRLFEEFVTEFVRHKSRIRLGDGRRFAKLPYCCQSSRSPSPRARFLCKSEGDRRGSNPRPSLEPQSDAVCYSAS
jgi:hypothetical protein